jgi:hypothetical protein
MDERHIVNDFHCMLLNYPLPILRLNFIQITLLNDSFIHEQQHFIAQYSEVSWVNSLFSVNVVICICMHVSSQLIKLYLKYLLIKLRSHRIGYGKNSNCKRIRRHLLVHIWEYCQISRYEVSFNINCINI